MTPILIDKAQVNSLIDAKIGTGVSDDQFNKYCREAQEIDFKKLVRDAFYFDILKNAAEADYLKILDPHEYMIDDNTYYHSGIKTVIAYFAYSRYMMLGPMESTTHGIVVKKTPHSEPADRNSRKDAYYMLRDNAVAVWTEVERYIKENLDTFDLYGGHCGDTDTADFETTIIK